MREFGKIAVDWEVIREPEPVVTNRIWFFPDFEIRHRQNPLRRWFVEIVGFGIPIISGTN